MAAARDQILARDLILEGVSAFRGERLVLYDIGFTVAAGGALLLLGPNGAGKSTLLRVIAGLGRREAGRIIYGGSDDLAGKIGYIGHLDAIKPGLTAAENLGFAAARSGGSVPEALEALDLSPLAGPARPHALGRPETPAGAGSPGRRRRADLAAGRTDARWTAPPLPGSVTFWRGIARRGASSWRRRICLCR